MKKLFKKIINLTILLSPTLFLSSCITIPEEKIWIDPIFIEEKNTEINKEINKEEAEGNKEEINEEINNEDDETSTWKIIPELKTTSTWEILENSEIQTSTWELISETWTWEIIFETWTWITSQSSTWENL